MHQSIVEPLQLRDRTVLAGEPPAVLLLSPSSPITYAESQRVPFGFGTELVCWFCRQADKVSNEIWHWNRKHENLGEIVKKRVLLFWMTFTQIFNSPTSLDWPVHLLSHYKGYFFFYIVLAQTFLDIHFFKKYEHSTFS